MELKLRNKRSLMILIAFGILLYWGLNHLELFFRLAGKLLEVMFPFLLGAAIAFVVNVPMRLFEKLLAPLFKEKEKPLRMISILCAFLMVIGIVAFVVITVIPELIDTLIQLNAGIPKFVDRVNLWVRGLTKTYPEITNYLTTIEVNWVDLTKKALEILQNSVSNVLSSTVGVASSVIGAVTSAVLGLIFSIYILSQKEKLGIQLKKVLYAYLPQKAVNYILKVGKVSNKTFSGFISGQCTEAVVFGLLCFLAMTIFRFPFASSVSVLIGFMTLLPVVGAFLGTALGAILIMVSSPIQAVWFIVMIIVLQQIDGNLIYPRIVGTSVGLPSIWVLFAVTVGGNMFGVMGMLISVPLISAVYALFRESVYKNLSRKSISAEVLTGEAPPCKKK